MRIVLAAALLSLLGYTAWRVVQQPAAAPATPSQRASAASSQVPATSVLAINPSLPSRAVVSPAAPPRTLLREMEAAPTLRAIHDRLAANRASLTPEEKFALHRILSQCAARSDEDAAARVKRSRERRAEIAGRIPEGSKDRARRLAELDAMARRCEGLESLRTSEAELAGLMDEALRGGDPKAIALAVAKSVYDTMPAAQTRDPSSLPALTDEQLEKLKRVIQSRDPDAILTAGTVLSNTFRDMVVHAGESQLAVDGRASMEAWRLVACEFGLECGTQSATLRGACAYNGQCDAMTVMDMVFFYNATPAQAQLIDQYRQAFRAAAASGDWSRVQFVRGPPDPNHRSIFGAPR